MRDLNLVVSVAHQSGVDPEASASTIEMRAALVRETTRLLSLENIDIQEPYALIEGTLGSYTLHLGSYTLHLGSTVVHRQPGGALCIVPVAASTEAVYLYPSQMTTLKQPRLSPKRCCLPKIIKFKTLLFWNSYSERQTVVHLNSCLFR